ncbi:5'-nucleotidase [Halalkaliarchaeum desulfuricum]|uniref:5'-nucleotidase n=1 Tax=Halalkaliarchaeum desulfuricum TaxID=2055893 RepID=A0A343TM57_9EURY|nr:5'-nucleotidase [Halalkaliarchaeum desulfuricum]
MLTNDDGIDSVGFRALYDGLSRVADVVAVAPRNDRSSVGRTMSHEVPVEEHELGYAIEGTPADCTVAGLEVLCPDVDLVVAGCNKGANIGAYTLGRSGTVSAAVEAAFFEVPAMAVSLYIPVSDDWEELATEPEDFREPVEIATFLAEHAIDAGVFEHADYLNVNAPYNTAEQSDVDSEGGTDDRLPVEITRPSRLYDMTAERNGDSIRLRDRIWERMADGTLPEPEGTDRHAVMNGRVSVSPLSAPHTTERQGTLAEVLEAYGSAV